jgi:hypothetical protein
MRKADCCGVCKGEWSTDPKGNNYCKPCRYATSRRWAKANKERYLKQQRGWQNKPSKQVPTLTNAQLGHIKAYHKLSVEEYSRLVEESAGKCMVCGTESKSLDVDHNHSTGVARGLLCRSCNTLVGYLETNSHKIKRALEYIEEHCESLPGQRIY